MSKRGIWYSIIAFICFTFSYAYFKIVVWWTDHAPVDSSRSVKWSWLKSVGHRREEKDMNVRKEPLRSMEKEKRV